MLIIPQADKVPLGAEVGKDVEEPQELPMKLARRYDFRKTLQISFLLIKKVLNPSYILRRPEP